MLCIWTVGSGIPRNISRNDGSSRRRQGWPIKSRANGSRARYRLCTDLLVRHRFGSARLALESARRGCIARLNVSHVWCLCAVHYTDTFGLIFTRSCLARAIENECIIAMSNIAGPPFPAKTEDIERLDDSSAIGVGRTCVCSPFVGCAGRLEHGGEALLLACIDTRVLQDARDVYKQRQDLYTAWSKENGSHAIA